MAQHYLNYRWTCPEILESVCSGQQGSVLYVPDNSIAVPLDEGEVSYDFKVTVYLEELSENVYIESSDTISVTWLNHASPLIDSIVIDPIPVSSTSDSDVTFSLIGSNFNETSEMS